MVWIAIVLLACVALTPLALVLRRRPAPRAARELAMDLHRAQLIEIDRDLAEGRILDTEHATARLEVQRRLLAAADTADAPPRSGAAWPIVAAMTLAPVAAILLYSLGGQPGMPSVTPDTNQARMRRAQEEAGLVDQLRARLLKADPNTDQARQGYIILGEVEASRGNDAAAADAWTAALRTKFDPVIAIRAAEAATRAEGSLSVASAALLHRALAAAPPDAPWRAALAERLKQSGL